MANTSQPFTPSTPALHWIFLYEPHWAYDPPQNYLHWANISYPVNWSSGDTREIAATISQTRLENHYDADLRYMDARAGNAIDRLKKQNQYDNSFIIYTSDHGELLGEDDRYATHVTFPHQELLHVPLIIKLPQQEYAGKHVEQPVRTIDIFPTVLDLLNIETDKPVGDSFTTTFKEAKKTYNPPIYAAQYNTTNWTLLDGTKQHVFPTIKNCSSTGTVETQTTIEMNTTISFPSYSKPGETICSIANKFKKSYISTEKDIKPAIENQLNDLGYLD